MKKLVEKVMGWMGRASVESKEEKVMSFKEFMALWDEDDAWYFEGLTEEQYNNDAQAFIDAFNAKEYLKPTQIEERKQVFESNDELPF